VETIVPRREESPFEVLTRCGGYYECPKDARGRRQGPLVGYAGRDEKGRQYVGDIYVNFAKAERHLPVLTDTAEKISFRLANLESLGRIGTSCPEVTGFCGAPEGGKALAVMLASCSRTQYIFPEKKIVAIATSVSREISKLVFDRHEPEKGDVWWIAEDVCNNFSTTAQMIELIESFGARVAGVTCFLNRSLDVGLRYTVPGGNRELPVVPLVRKKIEQYRQDDPAVAEDVQAGNVVWKPKNDWDKLAAAEASYVEQYRLARKAVARNL
jgi:adenine/guanine phosphoribosyltransferase-like PRPP-binding protein